MSTLAPTGLAPAVELVRWPTERRQRARLAGEGVPRLLLVEAGSAPPEGGDPDEDWIRIPADPVDLLQRVQALRRSHAEPEPVHVDEGGLLWRGPQWVALAPVEQLLVECLLAEPGRQVARADLVRSAWPDGGVEDRALDRGISRVRPKLRQLGLRVHAVHGSGYLLEFGGHRGRRS